MLFIAVTLAAGFSAGYAEGAEVRGPRPAPEVRRGLMLAQPALDACLAADQKAALFLELDVLAAGFVDRASVFASVGTFDDACVIRALRTMTFADRGAEPRTSVLVHLVAGAPQPRPTPRQLAEAMLAARSGLERCEEVARRDAPSLAGVVILKLRVEGERAHPEVIGGSLQSAPLLRCITRALAGLHVPGAHERSDVVWPLWFARPPPPPPQVKAKNVWEAPTLFDFLGCGGAFRGATLGAHRRSTR